MSKSFVKKLQYDMENKPFTRLLYFGIRLYDNVDRTDETLCDISDQ